MGGFFKICILAALLTIVGLIVLAKGLSQAEGGDYMPDYWDFDEAKRAHEKD